MKLIIITDSSKIDYHQWNNFVKNHQYSNIYHSPEFFQAYLSTNNYEPLLIAAFDSVNNLVGILLSVLISEKIGIARSLTKRSIIFGGPLVKNNDDDILKSIIYEYDNYIKKDAIYSEIREINSIPFRLFNSDHFFEVENRLNILIDLTKSEEQLWSEINSKRRNEIRRAIKEGTVVHELHTQSEVEESNNILKEVYDRAKLPFADKSLFTSCFNCLHHKKMIRYFGAFYNSKLIGTMYILCYKDRAIDWYAGSYKQFYNKYPNDLLPWEVFKILKGDGYNIFDFGGAGKPGIPYGVRDYKKKFGGNFIELKRYRKIHKPISMQIASQGLRLWQKINK